jgi:hypothetical protein
VAINRDQFAVLNFGYISGLNLLQYCPEELLFQKYNLLPSLFQQGINQAAAELKSRLSTLYDINKVLSNSNQWKKNQQNDIQITIAAGAYVSQIYFNKTDIINADPVVKVGTSLGAVDLLDSVSISDAGFLWFFNKYYASQTVLYFNIDGSPVDIEVIATLPATGVGSGTVADILKGNLVKDDLLIKILSILSIRNILGSAAATNKQLQSIFESNDFTIEQIMLKQITFDLPSAKEAVMAVPFIVDSSFKTLG